MGLITTIQNKTEQVRAKERIRPAAGKPHDAGHPA